MIFKMENYKPKNGRFSKYAKGIALFSIILYQKTISPDHGWLKFLYPRGFCRYRPTCSEYTYQSIQKHGAARGSIQGFLRILRCNPCSQGGWDTVR